MRLMRVNKLLAADGSDCGGQTPPGVYHGDFRERVEAHHIDLDGHICGNIWDEGRDGGETNKN